VLVVDDEATIRSVVARMLRLFGFDPVLVADGREASLRADCQAGCPAKRQD